MKVTIPSSPHPVPSPLEPSSAMADDGSKKRQLLILVFAPCVFSPCCYLVNTRPLAMAFAHINDKKINVSPLLAKNVVESPFIQASKEAVSRDSINKGVFNVVTTCQYSKIQTIAERDHGFGSRRRAGQSPQAVDGQQGETGSSFWR
ncbi:hypothetical protein [Aeromonas salmonicida]|uniref:hypothetical protein n=1 Tax=Aeromonas salmonicida TaxID=645 RepID=UPI0030CFD32A